jgi:hypothetical protein
MGWLATTARIRIPDRVRGAFLCVSVLAFIVTELGRHVYRPYVRARAIEDFGLADSIGNLGGIVVQIFLMLAVMNPTRKQSYRIAGFLSVGYIVYEFIQPILPRGTFDWKDVIGTLIGFCISTLILLVIWPRFPESGRE